MHIMCVIIQYDNSQSSPLLEIKKILFLVCTKLGLSVSDILSGNKSHYDMCLNISWRSFVLKIFIFEVIKL